MSIAVLNQRGESASVGPQSTYEEFEIFMMFIWERANIHEYYQYHDARVVLKTIGARRTGGEFARRGEAAKSWNWWLLPGGARVKALGDGSGISKPSQVKFTPRSKVATNGGAK